jgi:hypothetical protein
MVLAIPFARRGHWNLRMATNSMILASMNIGWIYKDAQVIELPPLSAVMQKEGSWYVATCPELGVASQGKTRTEASA